VKLTLLRIIIAAGALAGATASVPTYAHHSGAMFDFTTVVTLKGAVTQFQWTNPHVILWVDAEAAAGVAPGPWVLTLTSPGNLTRIGWDRHAFSAGDHVTVEINPLRDGEKGGAVVNAANVTTGKKYATDVPAVEKPGIK
jgi:Family of unknown function (DUF6152)